MGRKERKLEHIKLALQSKDNKGIFKDVQVLGRALPELNLDDISIYTSIAGIKQEVPIIFNAITGGSRNSYWINQNLASVAKDLGIPMAVGSQKAAIEDPDVNYTFKVVRDVNPDGVIYANLGAYATPEMAAEAVKMIDAQGLQIHLNVAQELIMPEGDRNFSGYLENISRIVDKVSVPVIVKEVGQGIAFKEGKTLFDAGVDVLDTGGYGGTNFIEIENKRKVRENNEEELNLKLDLEEWGLPTERSLLELLSIGTKELNKDVIASGGISSPIDVYKALVLGANSVAVAGFPLRILMREGRDSLLRVMRHWIEQLKYLYLLSGAKDTEELTEVPVVIMGELNEYAKARNIDIESFARRGQGTR